MLAAPFVFSQLAVIVLAQQPPAPPAKERYDALVKQYTAASVAWDKRYEPNGQPVAKDEVMIRYRDWPTWAFLPRFMAIAEDNPKDPAAVDALLWIVDQGQAIGLNDKEYYPFLVRALEQLERAQTLDNRPFPRPRLVMRHASPATERFLRNVMATSRDRGVRGRACLYLGELLLSRARIAREPWFDREPKTPFESFLALRIHPDVLGYIRATDQQASAVEGELMLERAAAEFADIDWDGQGRTTVGKMARSELDAIRRPAAAKETAP